MDILGGRCETGWRAVIGCISSRNILRNRTDTWEYDMDQLLFDLLKDESTEQDLVSPALPTLKALLEVPLGPDNVAEAKERYSKLVHFLLSPCLLNIDNMRGRSGAISTKKIKTNLIAAVLVLTVTPPSSAI